MVRLIDTMIAVSGADLTNRLSQRLLEHALPSGGWGYYPGKKGRIEPTCWALLALTSLPAPATAVFATPHVEFLLRCQRPDGLLADIPGSPVNLTNAGLAACVAAQLFPDRQSFLDHLLAGLLSVKGVSVQTGDPNQDSTLQGWPWIADTFSWVEPTAWCTLGVKKNLARAPRAAADARVAEAEKLLADRSCGTGGWNYGNAHVFGQDLRAYVPTTAIGLLALQDRQQDADVTRALDFLERFQTSEPSGLAMGLASICLRRFGRPTDSVDASLAEWAGRIDRHSNLYTMALSLYALTASRHGAEAFHV
jgi:hypothetical protein